jgi:hypothetical protein
MDWTHNPGRVAGFALTPRRLRPLPPHLYTQPSSRAWQATATANNIAAHELIFRLGIVSDLFCGGAIVIFLVLAHCWLLGTVDQNLAVLVVILGGLLPATIDFLNVLNVAAAMALVRGADLLSVFEKLQRDARAMLFLRLHYQEIVGAEIVWVYGFFP